MTENLPMVLVQVVDCRLEWSILEVLRSVEIGLFSVDCPRERSLEDSANPGARSS